MPFGIGNSSSTSIPTSAQVSLGDASAPIISGRNRDVEIHQLDAGIVPAAAAAFASAAEALLGTAQVAQTGVSEAARINAEVSLNAQGIVADLAAGAQRSAEDLIGRAIDFVAGAGSYGEQITSRALDSAEAAGVRASDAADVNNARLISFATGALDSNTSLLDRFGSFASDLVDKTIAASDRNAARSAALVGGGPLPSPVSEGGTDYGRLALVALGVLVVGAGVYRLVRA